MYSVFLMWVHIHKYIEQNLPSYHIRMLAFDGKFDLASASLYLATPVFEFERFVREYHSIAYSYRVIKFPIRTFEFLHANCQIQSKVRQILI